MNFDKILDNIRVNASDGASMLTKSIAFSILMTVIDVCVDVFVKFNNVWMNMGKTVLAVVTAIPIFIAGYEIACKQHDANITKADDNDEDYFAYRLRYSPSQRLRQSLVFGAVLVLIAIITSYTPVYTVGAAVVVAGVAAIIAYCRLTEDEKILKEQDLPDPRDVMDAADEMDRQITEDAQKELRREEINRRKRAIKRRNQGLDPDDDEDEDYDDDYDDEDYDDEMTPHERRKTKRASTFNTLFG